ncbi:hypothetical protein BGW37DRAFT_517868 [Umbelopsis sp. PMI_123]|nr:hypothetical protein BGW37DRAFT_517868 [Umbelopsis sp. PMI_123]
MTDTVTMRPVRFVLENESSSGVEPRPRGRKSLDNQLEGDRKSRNRRNQRAYRQRQQQQLLAAEKDRDNYKESYNKLQQRLVDKNGKLERMANLVYDMERLCIVQGIVVPDSIKERLGMFKQRAAEDLDEQFADISESLRSIPQPIYSTPQSDSSVITNTEPSPKSNIESPSDSLEEVLSTFDSPISEEIDPMSMQIDDLPDIPEMDGHSDPEGFGFSTMTSQMAPLRGPIPRHVALYYIQSQYLKKISSPGKPFRSSGLDPTPLELALSDKIRFHPRLRFLPCPKLRERLVLFQDVLDINVVVDHIATNAICWGRDPLQNGSWELPESLFYDFWYICDEDMVRNTNKWRLLNGRPPIIWDSTGRHVKKEPGDLEKSQAKYLGLLTDKPSHSEQSLPV